MSKTVYTIGHSTRRLEEFTAILEANGVRLLADIRTIPRSRRNPQFNADSLPGSLRERGIGYQLFPGLGGLRRARKDSTNTSWRNLSFRGYADHMQTAEFAAGLDQLLAEAREMTVAMMCAEALPWRCHRWLVADALMVRGVDVQHIIGPGALRPHRLTSWAQVENGRIWYPSPLDGAGGSLAISELRNAEHSAY